MLASLDDHLADRGDHDVRTVDHYMMAAALGDDATALRRQALQAFLQAVPDRIDCDRFRAPAWFREIRVSRDDHKRNVATTTPFGGLRGGMPELIPLGESGARVRRTAGLGACQVAPRIESLLNVAHALAANAGPSDR